MEFFSAGETTPGGFFCPEMERPQGSYSALGWNYSGGVILAWNGMTPEESFYLVIERLKGSHSVLG